MIGPVRLSNAERRNHGVREYMVVLILCYFSHHPNLETTNSRTGSLHTSDRSTYQNCLQWGPRSNH